MKVKILYTSKGGNSDPFHKVSIIQRGASFFNCFIMKDGSFECWKELKRGTFLVIPFTEVRRAACEAGLTV